MKRTFPPTPKDWDAVLLLIKTQNSEGDWLVDYDLTTQPGQVILTFDDAPPPGN